MFLLFVQMCNPAFELPYDKKWLIDWLLAVGLYIAERTNQRSGISQSVCLSRIFVHINAVMINYIAGPRRGRVDSVLSDGR